MNPHPSRPEFWNERYAAGTMPWDFGGVPRRLERYAHAHRWGGNVLIPGCGSGHEITTFADAGYQVTAIDFAPEAVIRARAHLGPELAEHVLLGDFFTHDFAGAPFDLIYERTFFCALPPDLRTAYVRRMAQLLKPGGALVGFWFVGTARGGPPYALSATDEQKLLPPAFLRVNEETPAEQFPLFDGCERWREYRRVS